MRNVFFAILALALSSIVSCAGGGGSALMPTSSFVNADGAAKNLDNAGAARKIVVFKDGTSETDKETVSGNNGLLLKKLPLLNATAVQLPPERPREAEDNLKKDPRVLRVDEDLVVTASASPQEKPSSGTTQPPQSIPWGINRVQAPLAWYYSTGTSVRVAILDTGIDLSHPDLQVSGGVNTINPTKTPNDDNGHGTHVAGTVDSSNNTIGVVGVGWTMQLYAVKALDRTGRGWLSDIIEGIQWCMANNIKVVNMSLGSSSDNLSFHDAITKAYQAGIVIVAAAGNEGGPVSYPAKYPETIAVSASDQNDNIASFSNYGPEVDLIAPGVNVYSTYRGGGYATLSGTSMATPHVTGAAALKLALNGLLSPDEVRTALMATADLLPSLTSDRQGAGIVNSYKLVTTP